MQRTGVVISVFLCVSSMVASPGQCRSQEPQAVQQTDQDVVIVKYGSLSVASSDPGSRVLVDGADKGSAADIIESVIVGEHTVSCTGGGRTVSGTFVIRKNETLKLEALFDEGKLVLFREPVRVVEPEKEKKKPAAAKPEKPKKPVLAEQKKAEPKAAERRNPVEERRRNYLNVMKLVYDVTDAQDVVVQHEDNRLTIAKLSIQKDTAGTYYRTRQGVLLCDAGPCEMNWKASFQYTDETGKSDALLLNWRETVFNGVTPAGTSKQELECCLNGQCRKLQDTTSTDLGQEYTVGKYNIRWTKTSVQLMRSDIMNEIMTAGRSLADYL